MNKANRAELDKAITLINEAQSIVSQLAEEEQEKFDNLSEGLQQAERGQNMEQAACEMDDAASELMSIAETLQNLVDM